MIVHSLKGLICRHKQDLLPLTHTLRPEYQAKKNT